MQAPTEDAFRALAHSSPWLFTTLHLTVRRPLRSPVEAWLSRPGRLAVEVDGARHVVTGVPYGKAVLRGAGTEPEPWVASPPQDHTPRWRADGLVGRRPGRLEVDYDDPLWGSYEWVAMLDPVELSAGTRLRDLQATARAGRETWWALAVGVEGYDPRYSCCPLLWGAESERLYAGADAGPLRAADEYPEWLVGLDRATGVVVSCEPVGPVGVPAGFTVDLYEVDVDLPDALFAPR
ncbi:hypothetical protein [Intrasporangium flavum]|uniref:hypothetical protein n=1 Tax=Intrasporangium flavum TaxID=1428657 RepID=UPI00096EBC66|nr:hypothetical protein [Intrasporangium flavum]